VFWSQILIDGLCMIEYKN